MRACEDIEKLGYPVTYLPTDTQGHIQECDLSEKVNTDTRLVSIMFSNNEIGTIQNIVQFTEIAHKKGALFHTDAV